MSSGSSTKRLWLWLGASVVTSFAVIVGIGFLARGVEGMDSLKMLGGAVFLAALMLHQSRSESRQFWRLLPSLKADHFRALLIPHLVACSGGLIAGFCLIAVVVMKNADRKAWINSAAATGWFIAVILGGALLALGGILWGGRRRRSLGLP